MSTRGSKFEQECQKLRARIQELEAAAENNQQQLQHMQKQLMQGDTSLQENDLGLASDMKPSATNASTSPIKVIEDVYVKTVQHKIINACQECLKTFKKNHQKQLEDVQNQTKDEAVRYFVTELKSAYARYRVELQMLHRSYGEKLTNLQGLVTEKTNEVESLRKRMESDRAVLADLMKHWAAEAQELRASEQEAQIKYQQLYSHYQDVNRVATNCKFYALMLEGRL